MPYKRSFDEIDVTDKPACVYLRSKAMYVTGEIDTTNPDEIGSTASCWCNLTQHVVGPDQARVDRVHCVSGRKCFQSR
jgi:hypothetical protein